MKYRITIHKSYEVEEKSFDNDNKKRNAFINAEPFMTSRTFSNISVDQQKKEVDMFLNKITRDDIKSDKELDKRERVVVNPKGKYGFDNAVFDDEVKIPRHLREPSR